MKKAVLKDKTQEAKSEIKSALQIMYDALNHGQQKQIIKNEKVKELFERYKVNY